MDVTKLPFIGPAIGAIERGVNSSEHNFKKDLIAVLKEKGVVDSHTGDMIQNFLDTGNDEGMGERLRTLIALGVIPPQAVPLINQLADKDGVPESSLDRRMMSRPMSTTEATQHMDPDRIRAFGKEQVLNQPMPGMQGFQSGGYAGFGMQY